MRKLGMTPRPELTFDHALIDPSTPTPTRLYSLELRHLRTTRRHPL